MLSKRESNLPTVAVVSTNQQQSSPANNLSVVKLRVSINSFITAYTYIVILILHSLHFFQVRMNHGDYI